MKFNATFHRLPTKTASYWEVQDETGKTFLKATVAQLWGKQAFKKFDEVCTKEYGETILARIGKDGLKKTAAAMNVAPMSDIDKPEMKMDMGKTEKPKMPVKDFSPKSLPKQEAPKAEGKPSEEEPKKKSVKDFAKEIEPLVSDIEIDEKNKKYTFTSEDGGKVELTIKDKKEDKKEDKAEKEPKKDAEKEKGEADKKPDMGKEAAAKEEKDFSIEIKKEGKDGMCKKVADILGKFMAEHEKDIEKLVKEIEGEDEKPESKKEEKKEDKAESKKETKEKDEKDSKHEEKETPKEEKAEHKKEASVKKKASPNLVSAEELPNGDLKIVAVDKEGIEEATDFVDAIEQLWTNGYNMIAPEDIGALTDAPIIGKDPKQGEEDKLIWDENSKDWWFPQYETVDPLEELKTKDEVIFTLAPNVEKAEPKEASLKTAGMEGFKVFLNKKEIDEVFFTDGVMTEEEVKKSLVEHDGYDPNIVVKKASVQKTAAQLETMNFKKKTVNEKDFYSKAYGNDALAKGLTKNYKPQGRAFPKVAAKSKKQEYPFVPNPKATTPEKGKEYFDKAYGDNQFTSKLIKKYKQGKRANPAALINNMMQKQASLKKEALELWKAAPNYGGDDFSNYYVVYTKHRDSDALTESNFDKALEMLGGENEEAGVIVARANHWAVGWVENLLVRQDATEKVAIAQEIENKLEDYPILDESDYETRLVEIAEHAYDDYIKNEAIKELGLNDTQLDPEDEEELRSAVMNNMEFTEEPSVLSWDNVREAWNNYKVQRETGSKLTPDLPNLEARKTKLREMRAKRIASLKKEAHDFSVNQDLKVGDPVEGGKISNVKRVQDVYANENEFNSYQETYDLQGLSWEGNQIVSVDIDKDGIEEEKFIYEIEPMKAEASVKILDERKTVAKGKEEFVIKDWTGKTKFEEVFNSFEEAAQFLDVYANKQLGENRTDKDYEDFVVEYYIDPKTEKTVMPKDYVPPRFTGGKSKEAAKENMIVAEKDKQIKYLEKKLAEHKAKVEKLASDKNELLDEKVIRIKAEKSLDLYKFAQSKGLIEDKEKEEFIEQTMDMDDKAFALFESNIRKMAEKIVQASDKANGEVKNANGSKIIVKKAGLSAIPNPTEKVELGSLKGEDNGISLDAIWTRTNKQTTK